MKKLVSILAFLLAVWFSGNGAYAQCTSADIMEPGFNFITSSRGCAPFTVEIQTLYLNSTPGTIYHVDWGDGSPVQVYTQVNPYPNGPIISHEYLNSPTDCGYQVIIEVENACNPLGSVVLEPINVIVWTDDDVSADPDVYRVCQGFASSISFTDDSNWNCFPRADQRENSDPRWIQWIYGRATNANRISGVRVDGVLPGAYPYYDPSLGMDPFYPDTTGGSMSLNIQIPATGPGDIGKDFYVTLNNWNTCNAYDEDLTNGPLNPITPGGDNPPRVQESRIVIVDTPTPDFVTRKDNASNPITWDFCINDVIYFDNASIGPGGSSLAYTWEFYDGPSSTDILLATRNEANPLFSYSTGGQKLVRLIVGDINAVGGCNAMVEKVVNITPTSIAQISASETKFCKDPGAADVFTVIFNDVSIGSTVNTEWRWEFYDENNNITMTVPNSGYSTAAPSPINYDYSNPGVYRVVLITRDIITKCDTRDEVNIVVYNNPEPSFIADPVCDGNATILIDKTTLQPIKNSEVNKWEWDFDYNGVTFGADTVFNTSRPDSLYKTFPWGKHYIALKTTNDQNGCFAIYADSIEVYQNPVASFTKDVIEGCSPLSVNLENTSVSIQPVPIDKYVWNIDYGTGYVDTLVSDPNSTGFSPIQNAIFENWSTKYKSFKIRLKSISTDGCAIYSNPDSVKVLPSIKPGFIYTDYEPLAKNCTPVDVNFEIDEFTKSLLPLAYSWTVSDVNGVIRTENYDSSKTNFNHIFTASGKGINQYTVTLQANIPNICVSDSTLSINVNPIPPSDFDIDTIDLACDYMIIEVNAAEKGLLDYNWLVTKGSMTYFSDTLGDQFRYKILRPGPTSPNLFVTLDLSTTNYAFCQSDTASQTIMVPAQPQLIASFTANPTFQVFPSSTVTITNTSTRSDAQHFWDFDDGHTTTDEFPQPHLYEQPGYYTIRLHLEEKGCESSDSVRIYIQPVAPIADFSFDPGKGCAPLTVQFTNLTKYGSSGGYKWYFGAGEGVSTNENPTHTYYEPGVYSVKLEATNSSGVTAVEVKRDIIVVYPVPHADFTVRPEKVKLPDDPIYTTNLSFEADSYFWDFGDGNTSNEFEPTHTYLDTGLFDIQLVAITDNGCTDTVVYENIVEVIEGNEIKIPNAFTPNLIGPTNGSRYTDGRNDIFYPVTEGVVAYRMQIYNRWGELLFDTTDSNKGWDGYYNGKLCPPDVYIYKMEFKFLDGREVMKFGDVTLIR